MYRIEVTHRVFVITGGCNISVRFCTAIRYPPKSKSKFAILDN